jgi:hypothetical protein
MKNINIKKKSTTWILYVQYPSNMYFLGWDHKIENFLKRNSDGSGMGMGVRDMDFYYKSKKAAMNASKKLKKFSRVRHQVARMKDY